MNEEQAVKEFLGDRPGASELREWRITLQERLQALEGERKRLGAAGLMDTRISQLRKQLTALQEEEAITRFVEDSVRVTLAMGTVSEDAPEGGPGHGMHTYGEHSLGEPMRGSHREDQGGE